MKMRESWTFIVLVLVLTGCAFRQDSEFRRVCQELSVRTHVAAALQDFRGTRGGDNTAHFDLLRAFCVRRQLAAPREQHPELADPLLNTNSVSVLLGPPDAQTDDGAWLYYFNPEKDWHLELSFRDATLFHTSYRQLISADELRDGIEQEDGATNKMNGQRPWEPGRRRGFQGASFTALCCQLYLKTL